MAHHPRIAGQRRDALASHSINRRPSCRLAWLNGAASRGLVASLAVLLQASLGLAAQADRSNVVTGRVRDASGGVIVGATIAVRSPASAVETLTDTGRDGRFVLAGLPDGLYTVAVIAPGFGVVTIQVQAPAERAYEVVLSPAPVIEEVQVVSASRQDELRHSLNTRVDVLTRSRIQDTGAQNVGEVLREVPGVLTRRGSEGTGAAGQQIQGLDSRQVLVLLDGQPLLGARGIKRGIVNLDRQSAARLERIEVIKGASSALYGSDAIGGVINLISRDVTAPLDLSGELSAGSHQEINVVGEVGVRRTAWSALFIGERHQQDGFDLTPSTFDTTAAPFRRTDFLGRARVDPAASVGITALVTGYDNHATGRSNGELGPQEDDIYERTLNANMAVDWLARPATAIQVRAYHARYDERSAGRLAPPASTPLQPGELDERLLKVDASISHAIGVRQHLQGGTEYWRDEYSGINRVRTDSGERVSMQVAWAQYRINVLERVTATVGARVDSHSEFGTAFSPKVAANARLADGVHVRASFGRGFRAPDLGQLYYRFLNPSNLYQVIGNPELEPEYATSLQIGGELATPGRRARIGINLFRNDVRDLIDSVSLGFVATQGQLDALLAREGLDPTFRPVPGRLFFTYRNINDAITEGVEVDGEWAVVRSLSVGGAYTYLDARDNASSLPLTGRHTHHGHLRLATQIERIGLRANLRGSFHSSWIAARATLAGTVRDTVAPGFTLWDAFVSQRLVRGVSAFVALDNLTNNQDPNTGRLTPAGIPAPLFRLDAGRTARAGVRFSWAR